MAFEIPHGQIKELQISLRKEAGLESYNPEDPSLPNLPSLQDAISELDPSPPYLRCKNCNGRLLSGVNSVICVFCGRQQNKDVPPDPIKFTSTFGYRWLLHSLNIDGSELVTPVIEENGSNRGQNIPEVLVPLSDILNLEIRWPSEPEKFESSVLEKKSAQSLNLAGFDMDSYLTESSKIDSVSESTEGQVVLNKHENATESNAFQGHENLSLFENVEPSEAVARSKEDESGDSFSGWDADFQSAGAGTQHLEEPKFSDHSMGSSSVDLSSHMDAVFGSGNDFSSEKTKENVASASTLNDWFEGDMWSNANAGVAVQKDQFVVPINDKDHGTVGNTGNSSSVNVDWIQENQWQTSTSSRNETDNRIIDKDDSFDTWNDFTSSSNVQFPSSNSLKDDKHTVSSVDQASEISLFSGTETDAGFGSSSQLDFFSTTFSNQNISPEMNILVPESSVLDRTGSMNRADEWNAEGAEKSKEISTGNTKSNASDVETLMSQMHDLSFMLENDLSVPQKKDPQTIDPKD